MSRFLSVLFCKCPNCRRGSIFANWRKMNASCPDCDFDFLKEAGYYTGAMFINYFLAILVAGPLWITLMLNNIPLWQNMLLTIVLLTILLPLFIKLSRSIWLHFDYIFTGPGASID